jgi:hypothetical protein
LIDQASESAQEERTSGFRNFTWEAGKMPSEVKLTRAEVKSGKAPILVIVARDQPDLWWYLTRDFARFKGVEVILDRRQGGWWQRAQVRDLQERGADRRGPSCGDTDLRSRAFMIIHRQDGDPRGADLN